MSYTRYLTSHKNSEAQRKARTKHTAERMEKQQNQIQILLQTLKVSERKVKITIINMLNTLMEKFDDMQK